jgi:transposase InsO family protein
MIQQTTLPIGKASSIFGLSRRAYYKWKDSKPVVKNDKKLLKEIYKIAFEFPKYGYRRMTKELQRRNKIINHKKVLRIMKDEKLLVVKKKFTPKTTQSNHSFQKYPNLTENFTLTAINQIYVSDITYIRLLQEFVYLAIIMDLFSRRCIGWALSRNPDTQLTLQALNMAIELRGEKNVKNCIHHSDHGVQYASDKYVERLAELGILPSMGEKGYSYDNAFAESFFKTLKNEEVWMNEYETIEDVYHDIKHFIEKIYNKKRLHSSIGYKPPIEYEKQQELNTSIGT